MTITTTFTRKAKSSKTTVRTLRTKSLLNQCLLSLFDSPLNKAGRLRVYVHTTNNVLIEIDPKTRMPRTYKRFSGLFAQLLKTYKIKAKGSSKILMKVIKNPITDHLPMGIKIVKFDETERLVEFNDFAEANATESIAFVVGAFSKGELKADYVTDKISVSSFNLTASIAISKLVNSYEKVFGIL